MSDCIIVGGGVIGLLTARQLFLEGVDVLLLEKGPLGGESSWAGGGIVSPLYPWRYDDAVNVLAERSKKIYPELTKALLEETGQDCEFINSGLFTVIDHGQDEILAWADNWSLAASYIDDIKTIHDIESAVGDVVDKGIWMPDIMQIRNPKLVKALKASFDHLSIPYRQQSPVEEIIVENNKVTGVRTRQQTYLADKVVIASGAWSAQFSATESCVDVLPVKGQMIMYKGEPDLVKRIVLSEGHYVIPRKDGRILAGSTLEKIGFDKSVSTDALDELHEAAVELVPLLNDLPVERQWAGLRPGTEKGIPYICQHDDVEGLYVHAGHFRNGIVLGAASAELMADIVTGRETRCDVTPYTMRAAH
ncbi:MAG: glycine oxidase ThiO [Gammaproteobacteria bacterium]|nr:glycine oxidase ThiO [Gammaproteobacteria bacterium]NNJ50003.1 glycine oxidase ThiO [Gammaproteobacteria bacterium]